MLEYIYFDAVCFLVAAPGKRIDTAAAGKTVEDHLFASPKAYAAKTATLAASISPGAEPINFEAVKAR